MKTFCNERIINLQTGVEPEKERILFMLIKEKNVLIVSIIMVFVQLRDHTLLWRMVLPEYQLNQPLRKTPFIIREVIIRLEKVALR